MLANYEHPRMVAVAIGVKIGRWLASLPEEATLPLSLALALLAALATVLISQFSLNPVYDLFGIERRSSDASMIEKKEITSE